MTYLGAHAWAVAAAAANAVKRGARAGLLLGIPPRGPQAVPAQVQAQQPLLLDFWQQARRKLAPRYAPGRLKQWLAMLTRTYPEAVALFAEVRREQDCERIDRLLGAAAVDANMA